MDLGSQSIKLVELEQTTAGWQLVKRLIQEFPVPSEGQPVDRLGWLQSAIKEFEPREVHLSVGGPEVAIRRVHVPMMPKRELPEAVKWQVKEQLPFPIQDTAFAFQVLGEVWEKDVKKQDVLVAAVAKPQLAEVVALMECAGVRVASVSPSPLAAWQCVTHANPTMTQGSIALVEIGASKTDVLIAKDGQVRLVRELAVGSRSLTEALVGVVSSDTGELRIDSSKAETFKRQYGVLLQSAEGTTQEGIPLFHIASLMRPILENLVTELSRAFDFYKVQLEEAGVSRVLLCGGGANLKQLRSFLADGLGLPVEIFNPLTQMPHRLPQLDPEQAADEGPRLAVAIGLALEHGQRFNVLSAKVQQEQVFVDSRRVVTVAAKSLAAITVTLSVGLLLTTFVLGQKLGEAQAAWAQSEPAYTESMRVASTRLTLDDRMTQFQRFLDRHPVWAGVLKEIGELMPATIELEELSVSTEEDAGDGPHFHLKGLAAPEAGSTQGGISQFVEALEQSVFFNKVELASSELHSSDTGTTSFDIVGILE